MKPKLRKRVLKGLACLPAFLAVLLFLASAAADTGAGDDRLRKMASRLVDLRSTVEELSSKLDMEKTRMKNQVHSLDMQVAELESQVRKEELRLARLRQSYEAEQKKIEEKKVEKGQWRPVARRQLDKARTYVETSIPFHSKARLAELDKLDQKLEKEDLTPEKVMAGLWSYMEDEIRITGETGLYRQPIRIDGTENLAEVARLGMVIMYFKTADGRVGHVVEKNGDWSFRTVKDPDQKENIDYLFESLRKRIREGYYVLPNPL